MKDKVGASDQISFLLNGKPFVPGQEPPKEDKPEEPKQDEALS